MVMFSYGYGRDFSMLTPPSPHCFWLITYKPDDTRWPLLSSRKPPRIYPIAPPPTPPPQSINLFCRQTCYDGIRIALWKWTCIFWSFMVLAGFLVSWVVKIDDADIFGKNNNRKIWKISMTSSALFATCTVFCRCNCDLRKAWTSINP